MSAQFELLEGTTFTFSSILLRFIQHPDKFTQFVNYHLCFKYSIFSLQYDAYVQPPCKHLVQIPPPMLTTEKPSRERPCGPFIPLDSVWCYSRIPGGNRRYLLIIYIFFLIYIKFLENTWISMYHQSVYFEVNTK